MNTSVSFSLAKLLKQKGYDILTLYFYTKPNTKMFGIDEHGRYYPMKNKAKSLWTTGNAAALKIENVYQAPTIAEVVMWILEKYGIWIYAECNCHGTEWYSKLSVASEQVWENWDKRHEVISAFRKFNSIQKSLSEAYEAAIEYTLKNLLK